MPLRLEIKRKLTSRSDRVKSVDIHPTEPWVLSSLWIGQLYIWNYNTQALVRSFEVTTLPVRAAKFIARKQWIVTGSDDNFVRVYNYNTLEKIKTFEAHTDYVRSIAVHPTLPYILTSSDDMLIKLWDWDKGWTNTQVFEGHNHFVMQVVFNPKDPNTFASASLDRTVKVWGLGSSTPHFTLEGHEKGVNCVEYFVGGEKPYLISGADDRLIKIWDYQNKTCVQTLEGHTHNVSVVCFHPNLPIIISGSEDHSVRIWHANTYRLEKTLNYGWDRVWVLAYLKGSNKIAIGYDEGTIMIKLGSEMPAVSMDQSGKIIWARHHEIQTVNVKTAGAETQDGERLPLPTKDLGSCEIYPQTLKHNANGRFVVVCGDGEYIIYTALAWRNKSFGPGSEFVWATDAGEYAVKESSSKIKIFKNFKEVKALRPFFSVETMFGGALLGAAHTSYICFYDWDEARLIRKIDVQPKNVYWSESGDLVVISTLNTFYVLRYNKDVVSAAFESGEPNADGIEGAFTVLHEIGERVKTATWVGDCFIFTNSNNRLNYSVGGNIVTIAHLDRNMYILGYIPRENRIFLIDKTLSVASYSLHLSIISYQTAIIRGDLDSASKLLPKIPKDQLNRIAQFLERQNYKEEALHVTTDPDHKFELALQLQKLDIAQDIAQSLDSEFKWKQLADITLNLGKFEMAEKCLNEAQDLGGLMLLHLSTGDREGVQKLAKVALDKGKNNIAFIAYFLLRQLQDCINLLVSTGRIPEAAFFARTYLPSEISRVVKLWREDLQKVNPKAADSLADPLEYGNLFDDLSWALKAETYIVKRETILPANKYLSVKDSLDRDLIEEIQSLDARGLLTAEEPAKETPALAPAQAQTTPQVASVAEPEPFLPPLPKNSPAQAPSSPAPAHVAPSSPFVGLSSTPPTPQAQGQGQSQAPSSPLTLRTQSPAAASSPVATRQQVPSTPTSNPLTFNSSPIGSPLLSRVVVPSTPTPAPAPAPSSGVDDLLDGDINFDELLDGEVEEILKGADVDLPDDD